MKKSITRTALATVILLVAAVEANAMLIAVPKTLSFSAAMVKAPAAFIHAGLERPVYETRYSFA